MAQSDVNVSLVRTAGDRTITLYFDTNTPHPHTSELRRQGARGVYLGDVRQMFLDGGARNKQGEPLRGCADTFERPLGTRLGKRNPKPVRGLFWLHYFF